MVFVKRMVVFVFHEERRFYSFQQADVLDVYVGIVDEGAGFHIAIGVDMDVVPSPGDTSAYIFTVIPEIQRNMGFFSRNFLI